MFCFMETAQCNDDNDRTRFCQICTALPLLTKKLCFQKTLKKNKAKIIIIIIRCVCRRQGGTASQCRSTGWRWSLIDWLINGLVKSWLSWQSHQFVCDPLHFGFNFAEKVKPAVCCRMTGRRKTRPRENLEIFLKRREETNSTGKRKISLNQHDLLQIEENFEL